MLNSLSTEEYKKNILEVVVTHGSPQTSLLKTKILERNLCKSLWTTKIKEYKPSQTFSFCYNLIITYVLMFVNQLSVFY